MIFSVLAWSVSDSFSWANAWVAIPTTEINAARAAAGSQRRFIHLILAGAMPSPIIADPAISHNRHRRLFTGLSAAARPPTLLFFVATRPVEDVLGTQPSGRSFGQAVHGAVGLFLGLSAGPLAAAVGGFFGAGQRRHRQLSVRAVGDAELMPRRPVLGLDAHDPLEFGYCLLDERRIPDRQLRHRQFQEDHRRVREGGRRCLIVG